MKFSKEWLQEVIAYGKVGASGKAANDDPDFEVIAKTHVRSARWSDWYDAVFKSGGKYYLLEYDDGRTENQESQTFDCAEEEIECKEVEIYEEVETVTHIRHRVIGA
jgi:hypothetical protein